MAKKESTPLGAKASKKEKKKKDLGPARTPLADMFDILEEKPQEAFHQIYDAYYTMMFATTFATLQNKEKCQTVIENVMLKLYFIDKTLLPSKGELTWLYRVLHNEAEDMRRQDAPERTEEEAAVLAMLEPHKDVPVEAAALDAIHDALDVESRDIICLRTVGKFSHKEIGKILNMHNGTVRWKYYVSLNKKEVRNGCAIATMVCLALMLAVQFYTLSPATANLDAVNYTSGIVIFYNFLVAGACLFGFALIIMMNLIKTKNKNKNF